nr:immunoglobulin light chain junction region [Macaca mulatta]MOX55382.1 immunoglobulin light chain junction region [Macaca mulatta]MOX56629.1 immunoglobulin light chain junction region [Macaca mulatta]
CQQYDDFLFTF